jgi:hypothetical protein
MSLAIVPNAVRTKTMHPLRAGTSVVMAVLVGSAGAARSDPAAPVVPSPAAASEIAVGCRVVATKDGGFFFGTVAAIEGSRVVVDRVDPGGHPIPSAAVDRSRVWRADTPPRPAARQGEAMICPQGTFWIDMPSGCVVKRVEGNRADCTDNFGGFTCDASRLVRPDPATQAAIKENVERQTRFRAFRAAALAAGKPTIPEGWKPTPPAKILIHNEANRDWYLGIVKSVRRDEIVVSGTAKWDITLTKGAEIVPVPTRARTAQVDQYVLAKWSLDHWDFGRVVGTRGDLFEVANGYDERRMLSGTEIIPIGRP